jgi:hypothetical protein
LITYAADFGSLTTLREKPAQIGARIVRYGRYVVLQLAEVGVPPAVFAKILRRIERLRPRPPPFSESGSRGMRPRWLVRALGALPRAAKRRKINLGSWHPGNFG